MDSELHALWNHKEDPIIEFTLIMYYSGYRIAAYKTIETNTADWYFKGGVKIQADKDRKRMLGHSFGADITNAVYGHRSLEDLRTEIEKIEVCY